MKASTSTHLHVVGAERQLAVPIPREAHTLTLQIEQPSPVEAPDEIRPIAAWAKAWGLELAGLRGAIERAKIPTARIGRSTCVRRSDLLRIVDALFVEAPKSKASGDVLADYDAIVAQARGRRR